MMSHGRLPQPQYVGQLAHSCTLIRRAQDDAQDLKPRRISHDPQRARQVLGSAAV